MIPKGLFTQIAMIFISIGIIIIYVKPAFIEIGKLQDDIAVYVKKNDEVKNVNQELERKVSIMNSVSKEDQHKLLFYMPDAVDFIGVQRDILAIVSESQITFKTIGYKGKVVEATSANADDEKSKYVPLGQKFSLSVEGTYDQMKVLFSLLEQNKYPLEIHSLKLKDTEGGLLTADIELVTYYYKKPDLSNKVVI